MRPWLVDVVACPYDHRALARGADRLRCDGGHEFPIIDGIPVLLRRDTAPTGWWTRRSLDQAERALSAPPDATPSRAEPDEIPPPGEILPHVQDAVSATCGILYASLRGHLVRYPIPSLRLPPSKGEVLVDVGCNWGRWVVAAARLGYRAIGVDPNLDAVRAARTVAAQLGVKADFLVGDARDLPLRTGRIDRCFSYSVVQHLSRQDAARAVSEMGRVLRPGGEALVQMPNARGVRSAYHLARRGFGDGQGFDVRYWTPASLRALFEGAIGPARVEVDGYFGLGLQASDIDLLPRRYRPIVRASELLRAASARVPALIGVADSLYVRASRIA